MNALGEFDLELLEDYLDDALSPAQVEYMARRLAQEPELALAMHELRAARVLRVAAWRSMEPTEAHAAYVSEGVWETVRKDVRRRRALRSVWISTAVAAGIGFFVAGGWMMRTPVAAPSPQVSHVTPSIQRVTRPMATVQEAGLYHVALIDRDGRLMPAQKFSKADDARQFARDLLQYVDRRRQAEQGGAMLVSDHF